MTRIAIIQGHPMPGGEHFCHALADAYAHGAGQGGHEVRRVPVAELEFPLLRSKSDWETAVPPPAIVDAQKTIVWAEHLLIIYPLWLGSMPALLKGFLEQALRPAFMTGKSGVGIMPALNYRWYFGAHSLKSLERSILSFAGIRPNGQILIGIIEGLSDAKRKAWLETLREFGRRAR